MPIDSLITLYTFGAIVYFTWKRLLSYLRYFQQEEYNNSRFLSWITTHRAFDTRGTLTATLFLAVFFFFGSNSFFQFLIASAFLLIAFLEEDPRKIGKITLKMTERAKRIFHIALVLALMCLILFRLFVPELFSIPSMYSNLFAFAIYFQMLPAFLMLATILLQPDEKRRQAQFLQEAKENLEKVNPYVIAITGSFGKTSTKAILGKLLEVSLGPTFWPPKSINTPMGVVRELRERLKPGHQYAVMEMGAYQRGSIERLCAITPPKAAIVTAVGLMHLERFGSQENIYLAKSELPRAVPNDGILVVNGDNPGSRRMATEYPKAKTFLYGLRPELGQLDCWLSDKNTTIQGTHFNIHWQGKIHQAFTKMHGLPALSNILAAFTMAAALGADPEYLIASVRNLEPFDNRLEVKQVGGFLQINDAYNSNPDGFLAALEVLQELPGNRKILITPGMIELGNQQYTENSRIAERAAQICDFVIVVGPTNKEALLEGLTRGGISSEKVRIAANREQGFQILAELRQKDDVTLVENDLPDLYEVNIRI